MKQKCHLIKKINISTKENLALKKNLDIIFNQPEHYLHINNQSPTPLSLCQPVFSLKKSKSCTLLPLFERQNQKKVTEFKKGSSTSSTIIVSNKAQVQSNFKASEEEMTKLFEYFGSIKENPKQYLSNLPNELKSQSCFREQMEEQGRLLKSFKETNEHADNLSEVIRKKIKRNKGSLLMDKIDDYRIKKEAKFLFSKYEPFPEYWKNCLRHKSVEGNKQKIDHNCIVVNSGTLSNPNWEVKLKEHHIEKIRNPIKSSEIRFDKLFKRLNDNDIQYDNKSKISKKLTKMKDFGLYSSSLNIVGKSLYKTEYEMFKSMKAKKYICTASPKDIIQDDDLFNRNNNNTNAKINKNNNVN